VQNICKNEEKKKLRRRPWRAGPSGCGKTTLLDILAGKKTSPYAGDVLLNGKPRDRQGCHSQAGGVRLVTSWNILELAVISWCFDCNITL
jgi:ABC-type bacteriocin/lantibiotic exporter with double-glycine peptidase domain